MRGLEIAALALVANVGCRNTEKSAFEQKRDWARSADPGDRRMGAQRLGGDCCYPEKIDLDGRLGLKATQPAACNEVRRLLETELENEVLDPLIDPAFASCYRQFPAPVLAGLCTKSKCSLEVRHQLVTMLYLSEPAPEITKNLLSQLVDSDKQIQSGVRVAMGGMGEQDLEPAVVALSSAEGDLRRQLVDGFFYAVAHAGLELPSLVPVLERLSQDSDADLAMAARITLDNYRDWVEVSPQLQVARLEVTSRRDEAIRLLAVRRFSCRTDAAAEALTRIANGPEPDATKAKAALALRRERCGREPE